MAPQIINRKPYSGYQVDIWSMGILLFFIMTGVHAFKGQTEGILFKKISKGYY